MNEILRTINRILDIDQKLSGTDYLKIFLKNISEVLDIKYALIGHPVDKSCTQVQTDVIWGDGKFVDNFVYDLEDTPCQVVLMGERVCIHDCDVMKLFPDDQILQDLKIEGYIGAPVARSGDNISSILILLDTKPIKDKELIISITEFLALRASAEIEKSHKEKILKDEVKEKTKELVESNNKLNKSIKELKKTQKQLIETEKIASLASLVAGVAHEMNTPIGIGLTGISHLMSLTELININYKQDNMTQDEFEDYLEDSKVISKQVYDSLQNTASLINVFKQLSSNTTHDEKKTFFVKEYIQTVLAYLEKITGHENIKVNIKCNSTLEISSYPLAYSQIITNLIFNSMKHGFVKDEKGNVNIIIDKKGNLLEIIYKDDGKGIKEENLKKIFEPFFTTKRKDNCVGLGLSIVYNIITINLKGTIECESSIKGTVFIIKIPM